MPRRKWIIEICHATTIVIDWVTELSYSSFYSDHSRRHLMTHFFLLMWPARFALPELAHLGHSEFASFLRGVDGNRLEPLRAKRLATSMILSLALPVMIVVLPALLVLIDLNFHPGFLVSLISVVGLISASITMSFIISSYLNAWFNRAELLARYSQRADADASALSRDIAAELPGQ